MKGSPENPERFTVSSRDYGGRATLTAETIGSPVRQAQPQGIPLDTDGDTLPDAWENSTGYFSATSADTDGDGVPDAEEDDDPTPAVVANAGPVNPPGAQTGMGLTGDGLTAYEEYRGFRALGVPVRTSPSVKDVFIHSDLPTYGIGYTSVLTGFEIHELQDPAEWQNRTSRVINFNRGSIVGTDQAAIRIILDPNQNPNSTTFGQTFKSTAGLQNETPNETLRSQINLAALNNGLQPVMLAGADGQYGTPDDDLENAEDVYTAADVDQAIEETIGHEAAHNLHVEHEFFYHDLIVQSVGKGNLQGDLRKGADAVGSGSDGICQTLADPADVQVTAPGQAGSVCVKTGKDGIADTTADPSDQQLIAIHQGVPNLLCLCPGDDGVVNASPSGDDLQAMSSDPNCSPAIFSGANGICESFPPTGTRQTIMTIELLYPVPSTYDAVDLDQVRLHLKHP